MFDRNMQIDAIVISMILFVLWTIFGSFGGVVKTVEHISHEQGYYYSYIIADNEGWPEGDSLRMGTQANVWVRLSTVPIWYHLWRSINALPPQIGYSKI